MLDRFPIPLVSKLISRTKAQQLDAVAIGELGLVSVIRQCCQELSSRRRVLYSDHEPTSSFEDLECDSDSVSRMRNVMTQILAMETAEVGAFVGFLAT